MKIFVSHEHSDAKELKKLKDQIAHYDVELFLAHDDLQYGSSAIEELKKELADCHAILHIGNQRSKESDFCDQELGFAIGLNKDVISVLTDKSTDSPWGFIKDNQAVRCSGVENIKFYILEATFFDHIIKEERRKFGQIFGAKGFYVSNSYESNYVTLIPDNWNDQGYYTSFYVSIENSHVAKVKIGYSGQTERIETKDMLLGYFTHLGERMFSAIEYYNFSHGPKAMELINSSLNCFAVVNQGSVNHEIINFDLYNKFKNQGVVINSLLRADMW